MKNLTYIASIALAIYCQPALAMKALRAKQNALSPERKLKTDLVRNRLKIWQEVNSYAQYTPSMLRKDPFPDLIKNQNDLMQKLADSGEPMSNVDIYQRACEFDKDAATEAESLFASVVNRKTLTDDEWINVAIQAEGKMRQLNGTILALNNNPDQKSPYKAESIQCKKIMIYNKVIASKPNVMTEATRLNRETLDRLLKENSPQ